MMYTFKCKAAGDVILAQADGDQLLQIIGKTPAVEGIVEVAAMNAAIRALESAVAQERTAHHQAEKQAPTAPRDTPAEDEVVELHQRIWPLGGAAQTSARPLYGASDPAFSLCSSRCSLNSKFDLEPDAAPAKMPRRWSITDAHATCSPALGAVHGGNVTSTEAEAQTLTARKRLRWTRRSMERRPRSRFSAPRSRAGSRERWQSDMALRPVRAATGLKSRTEKPRVTLGRRVPARERLGEMLMKLKQLLRGNLQHGTRHSRLTGVPTLSEGWQMRSQCSRSDDWQ